MYVGIDHRLDPPLTALRRIVERDRARALHGHVLLAHRGQPVAVVLHRVVLRADGIEAAVEQPDGARENALAAQVVARKVTCHQLAHLRERARKVDHLVELLLVAPLAPALVVEVLLAPGGVESGGLQVAVGERADPHLLPGGRDPELVDPAQHLRVLDLAAAVVEVLESLSAPPAADSRPGAVGFPKSRHGSQSFPRSTRENPVSARPPRRILGSMPSPLDGLAATQREAVTHPSGPLLVLGGAGTGKTRVLTRRFAWLVEQGTPPDGVVALVFSPAAVTEMRERVEDLIGAAGEDLWVETFHSFATRLLHDEALEAGLDPFFSPVTPADRLALMLDRIEDLTLRRHEIRGNPAPLLASFIARIDRLKDEMVSAADYSAWARKAAEACRDGGDAERAHAERELEFAQVYADHDRLLAESGSLDFGDLVLHAFQLLHEKPHVRARVAERRPHVLVDEYQELNLAQGDLSWLLV